MHNYDYDNARCVAAEAHNRAIVAKGGEEEDRIMLSGNVFCVIDDLLSSSWRIPCLGRQ